MLFRSQRVSIVQQLPTVAESGLPRFEAALWNTVMVPAGTPVPVVTRLNGEIDQIMRMPDLVEQLRRQGYTAATKSLPELDAFIKAEITKWATVVKSSGARAE